MHKVNLLLYFRKEDNLPMKEKLVLVLSGPNLLATYVHSGFGSLLTVIIVQVMLQALWDYPRN